MISLEQLNPDQRAAVEHIDGPLLILAGAGSGKTRVLTQRIGYLIAQGKAQPWQIMAVTFTNKAAGELKERLASVIGPAGREVMVGTFHSICARLLRREWRAIGRENFTIYDDDDQLSVIKQVMQAENINTQQLGTGRVRGDISRAKNELKGPELYEPTSHIEEAIRRIYAGYQRRLRENNALDFDDLIMQTVLFLQKNPDRTRALSERYRYISVDEYQDTNHAQYTLVKLLASAHHNLCVVGDDDQCLPEGTLIETPQGKRPIEAIAEGDRVCGSGGAHTLVTGVVRHVHRAQRSGSLYSVELEGHTLRGTEHHIVPARLPQLYDKYYVYLMYRADYGYRVGLTISNRRTRRSRDGSDLIEEQHGFMVRCNQEHADRMWVLRVADSFAEARYWEEFYSRAGAAALMRDLDIHPGFAHHTPQSTMRRPTLNLTMFADSRASLRAGTSMHRLQFDTSDLTIVERLRDAGYTLKHYRPGHYRFGLSRTSYYEADAIARTMATCADLDVFRRMRIGPHTYPYTPLSHLRPGMLMLVEEAGQLVERAVIDVRKEPYEGAVYDLEVEGTHTYLAGGVLVHNSIYGWRGADIRNILEFEKDYPDARVIKLEQNYRSTQTILDAAHAVVRINRGRKPKQLWTQNEQGVPVHRFVATDEVQEGVWVANEIRRLRGRGEARWGDCAVLYRTNSQSRPIEDAFVREGIPYALIGGVRFYERREIKDVLAYLRVIANPRDEISLLRIINVPPRKIGATLLTRLRAYAARERLSVREALGRAAEIPDLPAGGDMALRAFTLLLKRLEDEADRANMLDLLDYVLAESGYADWIRDGSDEGDERWSNVQELRSLATQYASMPPRDGLMALLENAALVSDTDKLPDEGEQARDQVMLITLHAAKGLEFPVVFITGLEENLFPHSRSIDDPRQMEEERRLAYVGITRAKKYLYLVSARKRTMFGNVTTNQPSRFVKDIPAELLQDLYPRGNAAAPLGRDATRLRPIASREADDDTRWESSAPEPEAAPVRHFGAGERVRHNFFGVGTVLSSTIDGRTEVVVVRFKDAKGKTVDKTLDTSFARLEPL